MLMVSVTFTFASLQSMLTHWMLLIENYRHQIATFLKGSITRWVNLKLNRYKFSLVLVLFKVGHFDGHIGHMETQPALCGVSHTHHRRVIQSLVPWPTWSIAWHQWSRCWNILQFPSLAGCGEVLWRGEKRRCFILLIQLFFWRP